MDLPSNREDKREPDRQFCQNPGNREVNSGMRLITWNIQWARGIDGRVDPARSGIHFTQQRYFLLIGQIIKRIADRIQTMRRRRVPRRHTATAGRHGCDPRRSLPL